MSARPLLAAAVAAVTGLTLLAGTSAPAAPPASSAGPAEPAAPAAPAPTAQPPLAPAARKPAWTDPSYRPRRGGWRDYVLAPHTRRVRPAAVQWVRPREGAIDGAPSALLREDGRSVRLTSTGDRSGSPLVVLDLGQELSGPALVRVLGASAERPGLHVCYSESLRYLARYPGQNDGQSAVAPGCDTANIWNGFPGTPYTEDTDSHPLPLAGADLPATLADPELRGGYRYLTLFLDGPGWVDVDAVSTRFTAAQGQTRGQRRLDDYAGHFLSSDHLLNKVWYAGAYTVQVNTDRPDTAKRWPYEPGEADHADDVVPGADPDVDVVYDGGKRDRIVWQGDLAVQGPVAYVSTHDVAAVENSLTSLATQQLDDGYVPAASLVGPHNQGELRNYGEYVTWFVANLAEHHRWTGDRRYLRRWWPAMRQALAWLQAQVDDTGLVSMQASGSCGHYGYRSCGHETYNSTLLVRALGQAADLAADAGTPGARAGYRRAADAIARAVNRRLWDDEAGAYRLSLEEPGAYPQDGNAMAVLAGVATPARSRRAMSWLRRTSWGDLGALTVSRSTPNGALPSFYAPLPSWFEVDARLTAPGARGYEQQSAFVLMRRFWGWMLRQDPGSTFWEHVDPDGSARLGQFSSLAHGWAAGPTASLTTKVLGVEPTAPGFARYRLAPHPGDLRWAEGAVPTPRGTVRASWERRGRGFSMTLRAPRSAWGEVVSPLPGRRVEVSIDGRTVWRGRSLAPRARFRDGAVVVRSVAPGRHRVVVRPLGQPRTQLDVEVSPVTTLAEPGDLVAFDATVSGQGPGVLRGPLRLTAPRGWTLSRRRIDVALRSNGRPVSRAYRFFARVPEDADSGAFRVRAALDVGAADDADVSTVRLSRTDALFGFDDGTDGWQAGENVASVASVGSFANGPGRPFEGAGALEATAEAAPGDAERVVGVEPAAPLDLTDARAVLVRLDSYGGAPGATGYEAVVRLTGAGGEVLERRFAVQPDAWNTLEVEVGSWAPRSAVSGMEVAFSATGTSTPWTCRFQLDAVQVVA